jgi:protein TonB
MTVAPAMGRAGNLADSAAREPSRGEASSGAVIPASMVTARSGDTAAQLRAWTVPAYTPAALSAGVEANVPLEIIVSEKGNVTSARALEHVGYGLDEAAQRSILGYRFAPAVRAGRAIAVRMRWVMRFQLR